MRHARHLLPALLALAPLTALATPVTYSIDPVHSQVVFNVDHNGFSRSFGRLRITEGTIVFDRDDWSKSSVQATIDLASVDMGDAGWDKAVRGSNLLDSDRARTARYVSDSVEKRSDDEGVVHGKLTLRGTTLPVDLPFRVNRVGKTIYGLHTVAGFSSQVTLDRTAYGMTANRGSIGTDVSVWLEIEAIRGGETQHSNDKETSDAPAQ
ncbi:YceI family protein [Luteibacter jiangsuensis]|uniref:YceI family protein n=1 Tax=Luteibacter jiangsuensis TaxID=637577 RepID=A0ABX0Q0N1_9GAMM|nr:YceI family protein [Luteibacter jiangsuensis]NID04059.1 YceI family protein [Luteibacter jiangsuensis]